MLKFIKNIFGTAQDRTLKKYYQTVETINSIEEGYKELSSDQIKSKTIDFKSRLKEGETLESLLPEAFALVKNVCRRLIGTQLHVSGYDQKWDMIPHDVQIVGAIAMHNGSVAEMQTGEGKTLTAVMPLYLNALTEEPVHLVTVNDYLAKRDCEWVGTILRWLGLTTGALTNDVSLEERRDIYKCDVVYGTASEFGFDYLRDNSMATSLFEQVQRGYYFAIIDELDSILIDEARTPLIISGPVPQSRQMYDTLKEGVAKLVRMQRDLSNKIATEANKELLKLGIEIRGERNSDIDLKKEQEKAFKEALRKLWIVSKGTPHNNILKRVLEDPDLRNEIDQWDIHYYNDQNKTEKAKALSELFVIVDEKASEYELTDKGISTWANESEEGEKEDFVMLDLGHEYFLIDAESGLTEEDKLQKKVRLKEEDATRKERAHNLRQLLRAHLLMEKDVDYIVQDNKIVIIDENTGRPQPGRRFSDGLHQAIEAKELVAIQNETQTYATVTLQNFFRMYGKLSGMTGTAMTEASELKEIYKLDVIEIPTNLPCVRKDANDEVYMTEREKYTAILKEIKETHEKGRPILIGTESVEISEKLSRILKQNKLSHTVLNAKQHDSEAEIIAAAGVKGSITLATNMAGRGTDIKLAKGIAKAGGLHVIGTTRHQSRRIDRQLRGRCARQGDPGSSQFFISFEDSLMRLFASPRLNSMLKKWRPPEGEPISASILNKSIETAQKRIEQRNYTMRKYTLEYDDVINKQRTEIYSFRNEVLHSKDILSLSKDLIESLITLEAEKFFISREEEGAWDPKGFCNVLMSYFPVSFDLKEFDDDYSDIAQLEDKAAGKINAAFEQKMEQEKIKTKGVQIPHFSNSLESLPLEALRRMIVHKIDSCWQDHLLQIDYLRSEVSLRSVGQKDPLTEFKHDSFVLFDDLTKSLKQDIVPTLFKLEFIAPDHSPLENALRDLNLERNRTFLPSPEDQNPKENTIEKQQPLEHKVPKVRRNELCPCGSGKKHKKCCGEYTER